MTATGTAAGSHHWMSPNRFTDYGNRRTTADDIYAFGCLCYLVSSLFINHLNP
jgi:serine/threonine protein kinase